jgi:hypothetical protein
MTVLAWALGVGDFSERSGISSGVHKQSAAPAPRVRFCGSRLARVVTYGHAAGGLRAQERVHTPLLCAPQFDGALLGKGRQTGRRVLALDRVYRQGRLRSYSGRPTEGERALRAPSRIRQRDRRDSGRTGPRPSLSQPLVLQPLPSRSRTTQRKCYAGHESNGCAVIGWSMQERP